MSSIWTHPRAAELVLLMVRVLLVPVVALLSFLGAPGPAGRSGLLVLGYGLVTALIYLRLRQTWRQPREAPSRLWWIVYLADAGLVTLAVRQRGGLASEAYHLYPLIALEASLVHGPGAGLAVSLGCSLAYPWAVLAAPQSMVPRALLRAIYLILLGTGAAILSSRERQARTWAMTDFKTRLPNFRAFHARLVQALGDARAAAQPLAVAILDVDDFRRLNAAIGHPNADAVLQQVAGLLASMLGPREYLARYGGEEFTLLLPGADSPQALARVERMCRAVDRYPFAYPGSAEPVTITLSAGVAVFPTHGTTARQLLEAADQALLRAKARGKNQCCLATAPAEGSRCPSPPSASQSQMPRG